MKLLTQEEIDVQLPSLADYWQAEADKLSCQLNFKDFISAFAYMTAIAIEVEKMNHHPNWANTYNTLDIELSTHDAGGLTALDFKLAGIIDKYYLELKDPKR